MIKRQAVDFGAPLPRITPEEAGVSSASVEAFIQAGKAKGLRWHSFMLLRDGKVFAEAYYAPYGPKQFQTVFSLSKSFTSVAMGIAAGEGVLSLEERVVDIFADDLTAEPSKELAALTLRDMLRMATGQPQEIPGPDLVTAFLNMPFCEMPGQTFRYNTMATYMCSAALKKKGVDLEEYLQKKLFDPMGIHGMHWMRCSRGICTGGFGFCLVPEVIAKFGVLLQQGGIWEGKRLIPEEYFQLATTKRIDNAPADFDPEGPYNEWAMGYGYQFWMCRKGNFRGDGMYGQLCVVSQDKRTVMAMTGMNDDIQEDLNCYFENIFDHLSDEPLPPDPAAYTHLKRTLGGLTCLVQPVTDDGLPLPKQLMDRRIGKEGYFLKLNELEGGALKLSCYLGEFVCARGKLRAQVTLGSDSPLGAGPFEMETDALAGYGVTAEGLRLRVALLEMLVDVEILLTPGADGVRVRLLDVHNPAAVKPLIEETIWPDIQE